MIDPILTPANVRKSCTPSMVTAFTAATQLHQELSFNGTPTVEVATKQLRAVLDHFYILLAAAVHQSLEA